MIRRWMARAMCVCLLAGVWMQTAQAEDKYRFIDDTGAEVCVGYRPEKVAVLTSSLADLWLTAGGTADITVGESVERGFAAEDAILVDDGAGKTIHLEALVMARPDFVLYSSELAGQLECGEMLREAGIPAAGFSVETFEDYLALLKICTDILGNPDAYGEYGEKRQENVAALLSLAQSQAEQPDILFVRAGSSARYTKAKTAENHFVCGMLKEMGTYNIAEKAPVLLDGLSMEEILLSDPDAILFTTMGDEAAGQAYMESLMEDPVWRSLSAVRNGRVHALPKDLFQYKPNARWDEAYAYLIRLLYGDIV